MGRIKRAVILLFSFVLIFGAAFTAAAATPKATNKVDTTIPANSFVRTETPLFVEAGELITINCTFSPRIAAVDFGLIMPDNAFVYVEGNNGLCSQTIRINETGRCYFAVYNNSDIDVEVLGYVYY